MQPGNDQEQQGDVDVDRLPALLFQAKHGPARPVGNPASGNQVQDDT